MKQINTPRFVSLRATSKRFNCCPNISSGLHSPLGKCLTPIFVKDHGVLVARYFTPGILSNERGQHVDHGHMFLRRLHHHVLKRKHPAKSLLELVGGQLPNGSAEALRDLSPPGQLVRASGVCQPEKYGRAPRRSEHCLPHSIESVDLLLASQGAYWVAGN
ncbi:hypothetical protein ACFU3J_01895 [Streptomyces sp. NPDC057411]|uniref:hypothetical protein n=1 Tax=unclassified Streptomyces TaxID=2593676 RepID=UPI00362F6E64